MFQPIFFLSSWLPIAETVDPFVLKYYFDINLSEFEKKHEIQFDNWDYVSSHKEFVKSLFDYRFSKYHQLWYIKYHNSIYFRPNVSCLMDSQITRYYEYRYSKLGLFCTNTAWNPILYNPSWWFQNMYSSWSIATGESVIGSELIPLYLKYCNLEVGLFDYDALICHIESLIDLTELFPASIISKFIPWTVSFSYERFPITFTTNLDLKNKDLFRLLFCYIHPYLVMMINSNQNSIFTIFNDIMCNTFILNPKPAPYYSKDLINVTSFCIDSKEWLKLYSPRSVDKNIGDGFYTQEGSSWFIYEYSKGGEIKPEPIQFDFFDDIVNMFRVFQFNQNSFNLPLHWTIKGLKKFKKFSFEEKIDELNIEEIEDEFLFTEDEVLGFIVEDIELSELTNEQLKMWANYFTKWCENNDEILKNSEFID